MSIILQLIADLEDEKVLVEVEKQLNDGKSPTEIFAECQDGMNEVGKRFQEGEYYVSDLMMAGNIFKEVNEVIKPYFSSEDGETLGTVVLGTVDGDIHDIGKDLVYAMLSAGNFEVIDVGVDAKPEIFVQALKENPNAKVLALSCLLTTCYDAIKETVEAVTEAGLRENVKIIIGGGPVDQSVVDYSGADKFGKDAQEAVTIAKELMEL
ncbi:cobalamin B12-binding domain-containing protein [Alkalibacter mobilis]|uniref:cobalamin B12-binding domain-containing protein n=1 Tax=Alkalibacter mobilis TaxID=2787712 RepID=UPI00189CF994|nr:cobalamin-dependent protein [Alkalibacter mobilis]MBF7097248.1 cobalamin-dependent protein [Alkalibacter mobilis]